MTHQIEKRQLTTREVNDFPDSSFLYIGPGGEKDSEGKTVPRSLRKFPVKDANGKVLLPQVRNALARVANSDIPESAKERVRREATKLLEEAKKAIESEVMVTILRARATLARLAMARLGNVTKQGEPPSQSGTVEAAQGGALDAATDAARRAAAIMGGAPFPMSCCGVPLLIDRPKGFIQRGTGSDGTSWERQYKVDYGFIEGTEGGDGEGLDVFVGDDDAAEVAFFITQQDDAGDFDELKVMLGFSDPDTAKATYFAHVPRKYFLSISEVSLDAIKALLGIAPGDTEKATEELAKALLMAGLEPAYQPKFIIPNTTRFCKSIGIAKPEQQLVTGVVLEPDVVDAQKDTYSAAEIEKSAHLWMSDFRNLSIQHEGFVNDKARPVESWILRVDQTIGGVALKAGTWLLTVKVIDAELWRQIKSGELTGFSIAGFAKKTPIAA